MMDFCEEYEQESRIQGRTRQTQVEDKLVAAALLRHAPHTPPPNHVVNIIFRQLSLRSVC